MASREIFGRPVVAVEPTAFGLIAVTERYMWELYGTPAWKPVPMHERWLTVHERWLYPAGAGC